MDIVITRCAGLDVHKATVVATVRVPGADGRRRVVTETFGTMTPDLIALRELALQQGTKRFSAFYERHAYLVYNLSLRITCDRAVAIESARAAFLASVAAPDPDEGLVKTAVRSIARPYQS